MYSATVLLTIPDGAFVPTNGCVCPGPTVSAVIGAPKDISPPHEGTVFSGDGETIVISPPAGYQGSVQLIYQLPDENYTLLGLAFDPVDGGVGQQEFPEYIVDRDPTGSQITVTDALWSGGNGVSYRYGIIVQQTASGLIGIIDPYIDTEN